MHKGLDGLRCFQTRRSSLKFFLEIDLKKYTFWQLQAFDFDRKRLCVCEGGGGGGGAIESDLLIINLCICRLPGS